eukprot:m.27510 g.27510  ORF g.27510 m.27510 type:complete len:73 (+) comp7902_c0_seq2:127-345(+)
MIGLKVIFVVKVSIHNGPHTPPYSLQSNSQSLDSMLVIAPHRLHTAEPPDTLFLVRFAQCLLPEDVFYTRNL